MQVGTINISMSMILMVSYNWMRQRWSTANSSCQLQHFHANLLKGSGTLKLQESYMKTVMIRTSQANNRQLQVFVYSCSLIFDIFYSHKIDIFYHLKASIMLGHCVSALPKTYTYVETNQKSQYELTFSTARARDKRQKMMAYWFLHSSQWAIAN